MEGTELLTKSEFARFWGVSEGTVNRWITEGKVNPLRTPGGAPRFRRPLDEDNPDA